MENESGAESEGGRRERARGGERERFSCCNVMLNSNMHRSRHGNRARREASHGAEKVCVCILDVLLLCSVSVCEEMTDASEPRRRRVAARRSQGPLEGGGSRGRRGYVEGGWGGAVGGILPAKAGRVGGWGGGGLREFGRRCEKRH